MLCIRNVTGVKTPLVQEQVDGVEPPAPLLIYFPSPWGWHSRSCLQLCVWSSKLLALPIAEMHTRSDVTFCQITSCPLLVVTITITTTLHACRLYDREGDVRYGCWPVDALDNDENLLPRSMTDRSTIKDGIIKFLLQVNHVYSQTRLTLTHIKLGCLDGIAVTALDFQSIGRRFDFRPGHYQVNQVNSAFHPSGVDKSSTSITGWG